MSTKEEWLDAVDKFQRAYDLALSGETVLVYLEHVHLFRTLKRDLYETRGGRDGVKEESHWFLKMESGGQIILVTSESIVRLSEGRKGFISLPFEPLNYSNQLFETINHHPRFQVVT